MIQLTCNIAGPTDPYTNTYTYKLSLASLSRFVHAESRQSRLHLPFVRTLGQNRSSYPQGRSLRFPTVGTLYMLTARTDMRVPSCDAGAAREGC